MGRGGFPSRTGLEAWRIGNWEGPFAWLLHLEAQRHKASPDYHADKSTCAQVHMHTDAYACICVRMHLRMELRGNKRCRASEGE